MTNPEQLNPAAVTQARQLAANFMSAWSKGTAADGYLSGTYDHTIAMQLLVDALNVPEPAKADAGDAEAMREACRQAVCSLCPNTYAGKVFERDALAAISRVTVAAIHPTGIEAATDAGVRDALNRIADLGSCAGCKLPAHRLLQQAINIATGAL